MVGDDEEGLTQPIDPFKVGDEILRKPKEAWWNSLDSGKQSAWAAMGGASAVAVLGVPILSVILEGSKIPAGKNLVASFWLLAITLPVAGVAALIVYLGSSPPKLVGGPQWLAVCAVAALGGVTVMNGIVEGAGGSLADFYCYNSGNIHETACRTFNTQGLATTPLGSPIQNANFLGNVVVLTIDARGFLMVVCGIIAGCGAGYLIRRSSDGT